MVLTKVENDTFSCFHVNIQDYKSSHCKLWQNYSDCNHVQQPWTVIFQGRSRSVRLSRPVSTNCSRSRSFSRPVWADHSRSRSFSCPVCADRSRSRSFSCSGNKRPGITINYETLVFLHLTYYDQV